MNKTNSLLIASVLAGSTAISTSVQAADETIMIEVGFGFGTSSRVTKTAKELANAFNNKFCYHRPSGTPVYGAIRYRYDNVEAHVGGWLVSTDQPRCDRDSYVVGLGYVFDTQTGSGDESVDDFYASYTPGISYTWGRNKDFNVQDNTNTNWRLKDNWQMFNRLAIGGGNESAVVGEVGVVRYGNPLSDYERSGETFFTIAVGKLNYDAPSVAGDRGLTPPSDIGESHIVTNPPIDPVVVVPPTEPPATNDLDEE